MRRIAVIGVGLLGTAVATRLLEAASRWPATTCARPGRRRWPPRGLRPAAQSGRGRCRRRPGLHHPALAGHGGCGGPRCRAGCWRSCRATATIAQMSTISPPLTRALGAAAAQRGIGFLDAPMSGTSAMVARGDCTIFVGGDRARADACRPAFDAIARKTLYVGETGLATLAKLATNLLVGLNTAAVAEALVLGAKGGLQPACSSTSSSRARPAPACWRSAGRSWSATSSSSDEDRAVPEGLQAHAGGGHAGRRSAAADEPDPAADLATVAAGRGGEDIAAIITTLERLAGMDR